MRVIAYLFVGLLLAALGLAFALPHLVRRQWTVTRGF
jgi:sulfite exporter TauE/SafE